MKTISYIAILSALLLAGFTVKAQDADYDDYGNDDARVIVNNYYDDYGSDYYYSSRISRFHRSYAAFDYYSPVFTDSYWYDYRPLSWGISIYAGGLGFSLGYNPYYYGNFYNSWYTPYYYDPYYYDYGGYYPGYYSSWYMPPVCWGLRNLWADLTWGFFRPFHWHNYLWNDFNRPYYAYHNHHYNDYSFRDYYRNEGRRNEASNHNFESGSYQNSRRGDNNNVPYRNSGDFRREDQNSRLLNSEGLKNNESRRSAVSSTNNGQSRASYDRRDGNIRTNQGNSARANQNITGGATRRGTEASQNRVYAYRSGTSVNSGALNRSMISRNSSQVQSGRSSNIYRRSDGSGSSNRYSGGNSNFIDRRNSAVRSGSLSASAGRTGSPSASGSSISHSRNSGVSRPSGRMSGSSGSISRSSGGMSRSQGSFSRSSGRMSGSSGSISRSSGGMSRSQGSISRSSGGGTRSSGSSGSHGSSSRR